MAEPSSPTPDIATSQPAPTRRLRQSHRASPERVTCGVCQRSYARLTRRHLATHGLTPAQYGRVFGTLPPNPPHAHAPDAQDTHPADGQDTDTHGAYSGAPLQLIGQLADACAESPEFLNRLAADVGAHLLGGRTRGLLAGALGSLLATRMKQAGDAAARLDQVNQELQQPWRLEQGGEMGAPTPTRDLLAMHQAAAGELDRASDAILRAGKLAIDERRGQTGEAPGDAPLDRYSGAGDALALPDDLGPGERAIMLALFERMAAQARTRRTVIDADTPSPQDTPHPDAGGA